MIIICGAYIRMESCLSVEREHEKVANKLEVLCGSSLGRIQAVIDRIESLKESIRQGEFRHKDNSSSCLMPCIAPSDTVLSVDHCNAGKDLAKEARDISIGVSNDHKDIHASISKFGRTIDKVCAYQPNTEHCT